MATIKPIFDQPPETERLPTPFRDVPYSPLGFGAATGAGVQQVAQAANDVFAHEREKRITSEALQAEADIENGKNQQVLAFGQLKGANAGAQAQTYADNITKMREQRLAQIQDPDVKRLAELRTYSTVAQANLHIGQHVAQQNNVAAEESFNAKSASALTSVALAGPNPVLRQGALDDMQGVLLAEGVRQGLTGDPSDSKTPMGDFFARWHGTAAKTAVDSMLGQGLTGQAQAYMAMPGVRESISRLGPDQLSTIENRIRTHAFADKGEALARTLLADPTNRIAGTALPDPAAISAKVANLQEPVEVKDQALQRALHYATLVTQAKDSQNAQAFGKAMVQLDKDGVVSPSAMAYLSDPKNGAGHYFDAITQLSRRNREQEISGPPTIEQESAFGKARLAIGGDNREFWATQSYEQMAARFAPQVTRAQLQVLSNELDEVHKWSQDQNRVDRSAAIQQQVKDRLIKSSGFNKDQTKWTDDQWTIFSRALTDVKTQQQAFTANRQGAAPTPDDVKKWIDKPLAKVKVQNSGWLWDDSPVRAAADVLPQYQGKKSIYVIPSHERTLIDSQLQKVGLPVSDDNRQALFKKRHGL